MRPAHIAHRTPFGASARSGGESPPPPDPLPSAPAAPARTAGLGALTLLRSPRAQLPAPSALPRVASPATPRARRAPARTPRAPGLIPSAPLDLAATTADAATCAAKGRRCPPASERRPLRQLEAPNVSTSAHPAGRTHTPCMPVQACLSLGNVPPPSTAAQAVTSSLDRSIARSLDRAIAR